jgi:hypothetical protein
MSLGIPTQIALGPIGMSVDLDQGAGREGVLRSRDRETDQCVRNVDLTTCAGVNDGRGSKVVFLDTSVVDQQPYTSSSSVQTSELGDEITRG